jgi:hypothetical protein
MVVRKRLEDWGRMKRKGTFESGRNRTFELSPYTITGDVTLPIPLDIMVPRRERPSPNKDCGIGRSPAPVFIAPEGYGDDEGVFR